MGLGQEAGVTKRAPTRNSSRQARTGSLGPRPSLQPATCSSCSGRYALLPAKPPPARLHPDWASAGWEMSLGYRGCRGRAESQLPVRPLSQELLRQAKQRGWEE